MPEIKISQLTSASTPAGTEVLAIVQSGDTKKTTINSLASALEDNLSTGAPTWTTAGVLTAGHDIIAGGNDDGQVALTINDGYGDASITFNHTNGTPDRSGSSARITSSVDSNQELLDFQLKSSVTSGTPTALTSVLKLYEDGIQLLKPTTLSSNGTSSTSLVNKGYIDNALSGKANTTHTHSEYSLTTHLHDDRYSQIGHGHSIANISNLQTILNGKIGETEINTSHFTFANNTLSLNTIQEGQIATNAISPTKLSTGGPQWDTSGKLKVGKDTGDGFPGTHITATKVGTVDTLELYSNDDISFKTGNLPADERMRIDVNGKVTTPNTAIADITDSKQLTTKEFVDSKLKRGHFKKATESESGKHSSVSPQYSDAFCYINDEDIVVVGGYGNGVKRTGGGKDNGNTHRTTFMLPDDEKADKLYISYYNMHVIAKSGKSYSTGYGYSAASISSTASDHSTAEFYQWIRSFCESDNCRISKIVQSGDIQSHNAYALDQQGYFWGHGVGNSGQLANGTTRHSSAETAADVSSTSIIGRRESIANSETTTAGVPYNLASNRRYKAHIMNPMLDSNGNVTITPTAGVSLLKVTDATHIGSWNGNDHYGTVAILGEDQRVYVTGYGGKGQAGDGNDAHDNKNWVNVLTTANVPLENIIKLYSGGEDHYTYFLAIDENYDVWAWGDNSGKQLGLGPNASSEILKATKIWNASAKGYRANYIITNNAGSGDSAARIFVVSHQTNAGAETDKRIWLGNNSTPSNGDLVQLTHTVFNTTTYSLQELYYSNGNTHNMAYMLVRNKTTNKLELWSAGYNAHGGLGYQDPTNLSNFVNVSTNLNIEAYRVNFNSDLLEKVVTIQPARQYDTGENTHIHLSDGRIFSCGLLRWSFDRAGHSSRYSYKFTPIPMD